MLLSKLFKNAPDIEIEQLSVDSRLSMKNAIFFCLNGIKYDGHDYIEEAVNNGAKVIVYSKDQPVKYKAIYIKGLGYEYGDLSNSYEEYSLNYAGIRFGSFVTKEVYDLLNSDETKWGVEYASGNAENLESVSVKTVYCSPAKVTSFNSTETNENGNYYQWSVLIEGLNYFHIDSAISARMFVEYEGVRYYMASSTQSIRTLAETYLTTELGAYADHTGILNHIKNY